MNGDVLMLVKNDISERSINYEHILSETGRERKYQCKEWLGEPFFGRSRIRRKPVLNV